MDKKDEFKDVEYSGNNNENDIEDLQGQNIKINNSFSNPTDNRVEGVVAEDKSKAAASSDSNNNAANEEQKGFFDDPKRVIAQNVVQSATEEVTRAWFERINCSLDFLRKYFNIKSTDVFKRLGHSLIPFNPKFAEMTDGTPDIYGPIWIYTTLIFVVAAAGSLKTFFSETANKSFFEEFVPISAAIIYGIGFGVPLILTLIMKCFGSEIVYASLLCIYGYSYTIFIPSIAICAVPYDWLQWLLIGYAVVSSTGFVLVNYWKELNKYIENRKYVILGILFAVQIAFFMLLKFYFFHNLSQHVGVNVTNSTIIANNTMNMGMMNMGIMNNQTMQMQSNNTVISNSSSMIPNNKTL